MIAAHTLRIAGIAIVIAALADPVLTRDSPVPRALAIVLIEPAMTDPEAVASAERLRSSLTGEYTVSVSGHRRGTAASACPADGGCIVLSDGRTPRSLTAGAEVIGAVRIPAPGDGAVGITHLDAPNTVNLHGAATLHVRLEAVADSGTLQVGVFDGDVLVGRSKGAPVVSPGSELVVPVEWVPIAEGPRLLRVVAQAASGEEAVADVGVEVISDAAPVFLYEPEATWLGTFVRRALAADARFRLDARTRLGPGLTVGRQAGGGVTAASLAEARVAVVTAPESLTTPEVDLLSRFARLRGGSVVLLPDRRPTGPVTQLLPPVAGERRETDARQVGLLRASELVTFDASADGITVLETADNRPIVVSRAVGRGRIVVSGALDAWRFRGDSTQFNEFFSSLAAAAIDASGPQLQVTVDEKLIAPGESADVTVEWRSMDEIPAVVAARATLRCADGFEAPVRLWPDASRGMFRGKVHAMSAAECLVEVSVTRPVLLAQSSALLVADSPRRPLGNSAALDGAIAAHAGVITKPGDEAVLAARLRERLPAQRAPRDTRPMRSPWWILPFAGCLGGEWWLRRRGGLR